MSLSTYFNRNNSILNLDKKPKLRDLQYELRVTKDILEKYDNTKREQTKYEKKIEKLEKKIADLKIEIERHEFLAANPDELVKEYLLTLPVDRKKIELDDEREKQSLTTVPDLSRFPDLKYLNLSGNRRLSSGFERLPTTLQTLKCYKTDIPNEDTAWIQRMTNLQVLNLCRNDRLRELPDLSGLTNLTELDIYNKNLRQLPNMPLSIKHLRVPIQELPRYYNKTVYRKYLETRTQIFESVSKTTTEQIICRIKRINKFDQIREELLAKGAKIVMNPSRIARLLYQCDLDLETGSDWSDIYEPQARRVYTTSYE